MKNIHSTAIISDEVVIGKDVTIGAYSIINGNVKIGDNCIIGDRVSIESNVEIGSNCKISTGTVLGTSPQDAKYKGGDTKVVIEDDTVIREYATVNRGTEYGGGVTKIGKRCYIMAYSHIAHDCILGDEVVMANVATLAGHVKIEDYAIIGGLTPIHQFVRIGKYAMVGGASRVPMDIIPFIRAAGIPLKIAGLNSVGLKRRNFSKERIAMLEKVYRLLFRSGYNTSKAVEKIETTLEQTEDVKHIVKFIKNSKRGISRRL